MIQTVLVTSLLLFAHVMYSQEAIPASGGEAVGNGAVSYSIGQLIYTANTGNNGSISQGVQQSIELIIISDPNSLLASTAYPNPTADYVVLMVKDLDFTDLGYAMCDIQGRVISTGKILQETTQLAMQNLATGTYLLMVSKGNQRLKTLKIIKE